MTRTFICLVGLFCAFNVSALSNHELIKNLSTRIKKLPDGSGTLIKSFENHSQSYIYDQALAIIAFTKENDQKNARDLILGLKHLQLSDGSLYFSYYMDGKSPYPIEGDKRIAGAISWVALAATHYQSKFKTREFVGFNFKLLSYLHSQILPIKINGTKTHALSFAPHDVLSTPFIESDVAALEHNLDAYAAFLHFSKINKTTKWEKDVVHLKTFILTLWDKEHSHFWSGATFKTGSINKNELYLDNQTWSLLALDSSTLKELSPDEALELNCEKFYVQHEGVTGFMDSKSTNRPSEYEFVWSEGTLGQVLAMKKLRRLRNKTITCNEKTSNDFLISIKKMKKIGGGVAYATTTANPDFTSSSSVAGTAWYYFASNNFNPFHMDEIN